jgi:hypothetical protein
LFIAQRGSVHGDSVATWALLQHKLAKSGHSQAAAKNTTDSGHSGIIPACHDATIDSLGQFPLGKECPDKVDAGKVPELHGPELQHIEEPLILGIPICVLGRAESVGDAFDTIHYRAGKVVRRVDVPRPAGAVVRDWLRLSAFLL